MKVKFEFNCKIFECCVKANSEFEAKKQIRNNLHKLGNPPYEVRWISFIKDVPKENPLDIFEFFNKNVFKNKK